MDVREYQVIQPNPNSSETRGLFHKVGNFNGFEVTQFSEGTTCSYVIKFSNGKSVCVYGLFANSHTASVIRNNVGSIALAYLPIRPLIRRSNNSAVFSEAEIQEVVKAH